MLLFIIIAAFEVILALVQGFWLHYIISDGIYLAVAILIPLVILTVVDKTRNKSTGKNKTLLSFVKEFGPVLFLALMFGAVSIIAYEHINEISGEFVAEYDVVVEDTNYRGGGVAYFTNPRGESGRVDLDDYRSIIFDDEDYVEAGDTIRVQEYVGFFKQTYYVLLEEVK